MDPEAIYIQLGRLIWSMPDLTGAPSRHGLRQAMSYQAKIDRFGLQLLSPKCRSSALCRGHLLRIPEERLGPDEKLQRPERSRVGVPMFVVELNGGNKSKIFAGSVLRSFGVG
jgi:hypothetical protein